MVTSVSTESKTLSVERLMELVRERAECPLWLDDAGMRSWADFGRAVETARSRCVEEGVARGAVVVTPGDADIESLAWLFGAALVGAVVAPLRAERLGEIETWKASVEIGWRVDARKLVRVGEGTLSVAAARLFAELRERDQPGLILATGGTTGTPKLVLHDLSALLATVPVKAGRASRTLPLMRFDHIGGLDMAWRALGGGQILVAPPADFSPSSVAATVERHRVEVMPATPSFLNLLLIAEVQRSHDLSSLRVIPYGAEPMPRGLLERLRVTLPQVDFVQRFGTSETGALPVRASGEGLMLASEAADFSWKIVDDELWVRSPARALGYLAGSAQGFDTDGWFRTGDVAEQLADGAVRVLGRREELINVGGEKVLPGSVEGILLTHPLVADCRVFPLANALLGQVVAAEIVWLGEERDPIAVKRLVHAFVASSLPKSHLPAVVRLVGALETTRNLKKFRLSAHETTRDHRGRGLRP